MSDNILKVILEGDNSNLISSLSHAVGAVKESSKEMSSSFGGLGSALTGLLGPLAALGSIVGTITAIGEMVTHTAELGESLELTSQKIGMSVEDLSKLRYAAKMSGVDFDSLTTGLAKLSKNMAMAIQEPTAQAAKAFNILGISVKDSSGNLKDTNTVFTELAEKFSTFKDSPEKTALAMQLFGRSGANLIPILNKGKEGLAELGLEAASLGDVMDDKAAKSAAEFDDKIKKLKAQGEGLTFAFGSALIPSIGVLADSFTGASKETSVWSYILTGLSVALKGIITAVLGLKLAIELLFEISKSAFNGIVISATGAWKAIKLAFTGNFEDAKKVIIDANKAIIDNSNKTLDAMLDKSTATKMAIDKLWNPEDAPDKKSKETGNAPKLDKATKDNEEHAKAVRDANRELEKQHILLTEGALAAYKYELAMKGFTEAEINHLATQKAANDALKAKQEAEKKAQEEQKKTQETLAKEAIKTEKIKIDSIYALELEAAKHKKDMSKGTEKDELEYLATVSTINQKKFESEKAELEKELAANKDNAAKIAEIKNKLYQLEVSNNLRIKKDVDALNLSIKKSNDAMAKNAGMTGQQTHDATLKWIVNAKKAWSDYGSMVLKVMNSASQSMSTALQGMINGQMSFGEGMKAVWKSIADTVISMLADMAAQWLVAAIAQEIFGVSNKQVANAQAQAAIDTASSETWAAYASIPFAGPALAMAQITTMLGSITAASAAGKGITAHATGGMVDTPTLSLMGEAGPELIAPKNDFMEVTKQLVASGASMYQSIVASQAYSRKSSGSSYTPSPSVMAGNRSNNSGHTFNISGVIGNNQELAKHIKNILNNHTKVFGGAL
jgi:hypothetical protein